ncbi:MAG: HEAT repeat domain-containing protein [Nostocaceae cyanobacterium]|nr:HEAT repeat domain-containing protein [Nostocaceae cyanobacterium]
MGEIGTGNPQAISALVQLLSNPDLDDDTRRRAAYSLGEIDPGNPQAISALVQLLSNPDLDDYTRRRAAYSLENVVGDNELTLVVTALKGNLNSFKKFDENLYNFFWHCAKKMTYPAFYQAWHNDNTMP